MDESPDLFLCMQVGMVTYHHEMFCRRSFTPVFFLPSDFSGQQTTQVVAS